MKIRVRELKRIINETLQQLPQRRSNVTLFNVWKQEVIDKVADGGYDELEYVPLFATNHALRPDEVLRKIYARGVDPAGAVGVLEDPRQFYVKFK